MAKPTKILDQYGNAYSSGLLYTAARSSKDFSNSPYLRRDTEENLGMQSRSILRDAARHLFSNSPQLQWAIVLKADLCVGSGPEAFAPEYRGDAADKEWGQSAVDLLREWHKICGVTGRDWVSMMKDFSICLDRDGDFVRKFVDDGYPKIQTIPAHRIGSSWSFDQTVKDGFYKGLPVRDGVILDSYMRPLAVQVFDSRGKWQEDVSCVNLYDANDDATATADCVLEFEPRWSDQARGIPPLASAIPSWKNLSQYQKYVMMALRKEASYAVIEKNESAQVADPKSDEFIQTTGINGGTIWQESVEGGITHIYKSGTNSDVVFPVGSNRPSTEQAAFWDDTVQRAAFLAIGFPAEFFNATKSGGASLRLVMELAQYSLESRQTILQRMAWQIDSWRVAKAIKSGELPMPSNPRSWRMIFHTPPEQVTADKGYSSKIRQDELLLGITSMQRVRASDGQNHKQVREENLAYGKEMIADADELVKESGGRISFEFALSMISRRSANPPQNTAEKTETNQNANTP